jgi:hypothetical protein
MASHGAGTTASAAPRVDQIKARRRRTRGGAEDDAGGEVRRLQPLEFERLQGFPEGWRFTIDQVSRDVERRIQEKARKK